MDIVRIGMVGLIGVLLAVPLKSYKSEYGIYAAFAVCLLLLTYAIDYFTKILTGMERLQGYLGENFQYLSVLFKAVGAAYLYVEKNSRYNSILSDIMASDGGTGFRRGDVLAGNGYGGRAF